MTTHGTRTVDGLVWGPMRTHGAPTPQRVTPEQRRAAKATRQAQRDARKRTRKAGRK
jgi:hypothetical protein